MSSFPAYTYKSVGKEMTIPIYKELQKFQDKFPPTYQLIAGYMGFTGKPKEEKKTNKVGLNLFQSLQEGSKGESIEPRMI